jgi:hypothetical protein
MTKFNILKSKLIENKNINLITFKYIIPTLSEVNNKLFINFFEKNLKIFNFSEKLLINFDIIEEKLGG